MIVVGDLLSSTGVLSPEVVALGGSGGEYHGTICPSRQATGPPSLRVNQGQHGGQLGHVSI